MTKKMVTSSGFSRAAADSNPIANNDEGVGAVEQQEGSVNTSSHSIVKDLESFINRLSKWLAGGLLCALILWRHDPEFFWAAIGSLLNAHLSFMLKTILNQERPFSTLRSDPGMPSSHAQSIFYTTVFVILSLVKAQGVNELTFVAAGLILASGSYLAWLRVTQRLHSPSQVIVGAALGSAFSMLWFWSWGVFVLKAYNSFSWVRILIVLSAIGYNLMFLILLIQNWFKPE